MEEEEYQYNPNSTTIKELDEIEQSPEDLIERNSDYINKTIMPDSNYPDPLRKPLFIKTIPELDKPEIKKETMNFSKLSVKEFFSKISNDGLSILQELLNSKETIVVILTKEERLVSIGVYMIVLAIFFIFFNKIE